MSPDGSYVSLPTNKGLVNVAEERNEDIKRPPPGQFISDNSLQNVACQTMGCKNLVEVSRSLSVTKLGLMNEYPYIACTGFHPLKWELSACSASHPYEYTIMM